jgi:hypothetical protein
MATSPRGLLGDNPPLTSRIVTSKVHDYFIRYVVYTLTALLDEH